jgi:hypothetical protein
MDDEERNPAGLACVSLPGANQLLRRVWIYDILTRPEN